MSRIVLCSLGLLALSVAPALAQSKQPAKGPSGPEIRYFTSFNDVMDGEADVILKETRQGGRITAASLDMCYPSAPNSSIKERFSLDLAVNGQTMTGTTQTMRAKLPVNVSLTQRGTQGKFEFKGRITAGSIAADINSTENSDISEQEFKDDAISDENIVADPKDFTEVSPESLAVKVKLDSIVDFVKSLRGEKVELSVDSLTATCNELRTGEQVVYLSVNPENAPAILAKLKGATGVVDAGWTDGSFEIDRTLRFAATPFSEGGKFNRDKLATEIGNVLSKTLSAKSSSFKWDDDSGQLTLTLKRPFATMPALELTDTLEFTAMISPDKPRGSDRYLLWLSNPTVTTVDENPGQKLSLSSATTTSDEEGSLVDDGGSIAALATALKAQRWDTTKNTWQ